MGIVIVEVVVCLRRHPEQPILDLLIALPL
jgi:hypothetical protein